MKEKFKKIKSYETFVKYNPPFLLDPNYYCKTVEKFNIRLSYLTKVKINPLTKPSFFGRYPIKKIDLFKSHELIQSLITKMYYPYPGRKPIEISPLLCSGDLREKLVYQNLHLRYWNACILPSPQVFDFFSKVVRIQGNKDKILGLLMDYWEGETHDLDILAIDGEISKEKEKLNGSVSEGFKKGAEIRITHLEKEKEKIVLSVLNTINEFSLFGTYHLDKKDKEGFEDIKEKTINHPTGFYLSKGTHYLTGIFLWNLILDNSLSLEQILKMNIGEKFDKQLTQIKDAFSQGVQPIISLLSDPQKQRYSQGDEFLHNMQYHNFPSTDGFIKKTGFFDAAGVLMNREEESKSKVLLSFLLDLDYKTVRKYFIKSLESKGEIVNQNKHMPGLENYLVDTEESLKAFDMIALYELMRCIGRRAQHSLVNREYYEHFINSELEYNNPLLNLGVTNNEYARRQISLLPYKAELANVKMQRRLEERMDIMLGGGGLGYELTDIEKKGIEKLKCAYKKAKILH